eukprot:gene18657-868_t
MPMVDGSTHKKLFANGQIQKAKKILQERLARTPLGSNTARYFAPLMHNLAHVCKHAYQQALQNEVVFFQCYETPDELPNEVLDRLIKINQALGLDAPRIFQNFYAMPKLHKSPPSWRFLAGIQLAISGGNMKDIKLRNTKNYGRYFIVDSPEEMSILLKQQPKICNTNAQILRF